MAFDLYFAGVQSVASEERLEELEAPRLLSYLNDQARIKRRLAKEIPTFVDSGAYSAHTKGVEIDIDLYCQWLNDNDAGVRIAAELDHIPGRFRKPKTKQDLMEAPEISWRNYVYMAERVKAWEKILPIFHQGEDFKHLVRMLEHEPKIPYIGISPANDLSQARKNVWIEKVFDVIKASSHPNVKTHAFGMTALHVLERFPFTSADSTSWIMTGANGAIMTKFGIVPVSENYKKDPKYVGNQPKPIKDAIEAYVEEQGFTLKALAEHYTPRMLFNIEYLHKWAQSYEYKPQTVKQRGLF